MTTNDQQHNPQTQLRPQPSAVETWAVLPQDITFSDPKISTILTKTPSHVILQQPTAELVHAVVVVQSKLSQHDTRSIFREAFSKWAWNITSDGDLKDEASLTPAERDLWHRSMKQEPTLSHHPVLTLADKRHREETDDNGQPAKRTKCTEHDEQQQELEIIKAEIGKVRRSNIPQAKRS